MKLPVPSLPLVGYALAAGLILGALAGWRVTSWAHQKHELVAVRSALAQAQTNYNAIISDLKRQIQRGHEASSSHQAEIARLRARPVPTRTVRLCVDPAVPASSGADPAPGGPDAAVAGGGVVPPRAGPDIGPELYALADRADELAAQCRGLQRFNAR